MPTSIVDNSSTNIIRPNLELSQQVHAIIDPTKLTADDLAQMKLTSGQTWKVDDDGAMVIVVPKPDDPGIVNNKRAWSLIDQTNGARLTKYGSKYKLTAKAGQSSGGDTGPGITNPGGSGPVITNPGSPTATMNFGDVEPNSTTFVWVQRSFIDNNGPSFSFSDSELAGCSITPGDLTGASVSGTGPYNIMSWPICNISSSSDGYMIRVVGDFSSGSWDDYCLVTMVLDGSTYRASQVFYISEEPEWNTTGETIIYAGDPPAQPYANVSFIPSEPASASIFAWIDKDFMDDDPNHVFADGELDGAILTWPQLSGVPVTKSGDGYVVQSWSVANAVSVGESTIIRVNDAFSSGNQNDYYLVKLTTISTNQYAMSDIYKVTTTNWSVDGSSLLVVVAPA